MKKLKAGIIGFVIGFFLAFMYFWIRNSFSSDILNMTFSVISGLVFFNFIDSTNWLEAKIGVNLSLLLLFIIPGITFAVYGIIISTILNFKNKSKIQ